MLVVEQWAELRRLHFSENVGIRELARRFGLHRNTVRRAPARAEPPKYTRAHTTSKLDPFKDEVHRLLKDEPRLPAVRIRGPMAPLPAFLQISVRTRVRQEVSFDLILDQPSGHARGWKCCRHLP